jgi:ribosomal protein S18 acetylase RimI-like enzyme
MPRDRKTNFGNELMISFAWIDPHSDTSEIATFLADVIAADAGYISHGEIQTGLSVDGVSWSPALRALMTEDFSDLDDERSIVIARNAENALIGAAVVAWTVTPRVSFATLEDLAVSPEWRKHGVGAKLVDTVEKRALENGARWLFLESGLNNQNAHAFFERGGFEAISKVFVKQLK